MTLDELLGQFADAVADRVVARLNGGPRPDPAAPERWLTAAQVAEILATTRRWCYDHEDELGAKRLSRRCVRFSEAAVRRYMERRR